MNEDDELTRLCASLASEQSSLAVLDTFYEGTQATEYMAAAMIAEVGDRIAQVVINWPRLVADAYEQRLDIEGFRYSDDPVGDETLRAVWQGNNLDEQAQQAHLDSLVLKRSYVIVGAPDKGDDMPIVTVESPMQVYARRDPRTRKVTSAVKRWDVLDVDGRAEQHATLYLPDSTGGRVYDKGRWVKTSTDAHEMGVVPVEPLVNRPRIMHPDGVSEFQDVIKLSNAACKMATDMMVSAEFHAIPRRWVVGMDEKDFRDETGARVSPWSLLAGNLWASASDTAKMGQFPEAELSNFHNSLKLLAQMVAQIAALPPHYLGFTGDNPASADAIRSAETQLVKRIERKHVVLGGGWESAMRTVLRVMTGTWDPRARLLETEWRNPATPTVAQKADAAVKLRAANIIPREQTWIDLGYTAVQRQTMKTMMAEEASATLRADLALISGDGAVEV